MEQEQTYTEAYDELQRILNRIEKGAITLDELSREVKKATELIAFCKQKLTATEADVTNVLEQLKEGDPV